MKELFGSKSFKLMTMLVAALFGIMLFTAVQGGSTVLASVFGFVSTPMQKVGAMVVNNAAAAAEPLAASKEDLLAHIQQLEEENARLRTQLADYNKYQTENAQLRKYLELKSENQDFKPVPAAVIGRGSGELFGGFTIDKGTLDGISVGDPVVTEAGLVGKVTAVRATHSRVTTILSPDNNVAALDSETRDIGVIESDLKLADAGIVHFTHLAADTQVKAGDMIVTSGSGGIYPANLKIGVVTELKQSEFDVSLIAVIKPLVDVTTVRDVMVITQFEGQGEALTEILPEDPATAPGGQG